MKLKTLIVDDEAPARERLRNLLANNESVELIGEAKDGAEAVERIELSSPDLVLLDIQMPVLDGFAAAQKIRDPDSAVPDHRVPIIALTAHALKEDRQRCLAAGMDDYLPKPITLPALKAILERWLPQDGG